MDVITAVPKYYLIFQ